MCRWETPSFSASFSCDNFAFVRKVKIRLRLLVTQQRDHFLQLLRIAASLDRKLVSLSSGLPVLFGVLTTDNIEQAIERAGTKAGNKGYDVAVSAIEMVNLFKNM